MVVVFATGLCSMTNPFLLCPLFLRLDYQPLFGKMSPHSSPERVSLRGGSKTGPRRRWKSSLFISLMPCDASHFKTTAKTLLWKMSERERYKCHQNCLYLKYINLLRDTSLVVLFNHKMYSVANV